MNTKVGTEIKAGNNRLSMSNLYRWQAQYLSNNPEDFAAVSRFLSLVLEKQRRRKP